MREHTRLRADVEVMKTASVFFFRGMGYLRDLPRGFVKSEVDYANWTRYLDQLWK